MDSYAGNLLLDQWLKDMIQGTLLNMMIGLACSPFYVTRGIMAGFGMTMWLNQFEADLNSGDQELILYDLMQAGSLLGSFCCKCFTGDTLVRTEAGFTQIGEIKAGDYVLAENVETGEKEYKKVLKVYVKEATKLVHLRTDGTRDEDQTIDTTANHPFYVEGRGWVAAEDVDAGDRLHTEDGACVTVTGKEVENLKQPVKVYNLEVEDYHTYYVTADEVLVHNMYGANKNSYVNSIKISSQKMYQLGDHFNKHGRKMGYASKKEYEAGARNFYYQNADKAEIYEGIWKASSGDQVGEEQIIIRYDGKQLIINKNTGQLITFYEGISLDGFIGIKRRQ